MKKLLFILLLFACFMVKGQSVNSTSIIKNLPGLYQLKQKALDGFTSAILNIVYDRTENQFYGSFTFFLDNLPFGKPYWSYGKIQINQSKNIFLLEYVPYLDFSGNESELHKLIINGRKNDQVYELINQNGKLILKQITIKPNVFFKKISSNNSKSSIEMYRNMFKNIN